jgi:hypothetical protein
LWTTFWDCRCPGESPLIDSMLALLFGASWHQAAIGTDYFAADGPGTT